MPGTDPPMGQAASPALIKVRRSRIVYGMTPFLDSLVMYVCSNFFDFTPPSETCITLHNESSELSIQLHYFVLINVKLKLWQLLRKNPLRII